MQRIRKILETPFDMEKTTGICASFILAAFAFVSAATELPKSFKLKNGQEINNAKILDRDDAVLKISHDSGIAKVKIAELPEEVLLSLGIESNAEEEIRLPNPLMVQNKTYSDAVLLSVEPDGIKIKHALGITKIAYESLPENLLKECGPFDPALALKFRSESQERDREALRLAKEAESKATLANNRSLAASAEERNASKQELIDNPSKISDFISVELSAYSVGGKKNLQTGGVLSSTKTETSSRSMRCLVKSKMSDPQRIRLQCLFITRGITGGEQLKASVVADGMVELGEGASKTIEASASAQQVDQRSTFLTATPSQSPVITVWQLRSISGEKYIGWVWRVLDGKGRVISVRSSIPHYDRFGWTTPVN